MRFDYVAADRARSHREAEPHSLVNLGRRWYLVAYDCDRDAWRTFRVDRITRPRGAAKRFLPRPLPAPDAAAYVTSNLASAPQAHEACVVLHAPVADVLARHRWARPYVEALDEDRCELRLGETSLDWLAIRIGMLGFSFDVLGPPELIERFGVLADRFGAAAGHA